MTRPNRHHRFGVARLLALALLLSSACGGAPMLIRSAVDRAVTFEDVTTVAFLGPEHAAGGFRRNPPSATTNDVVRAVIEDALDVAGWQVVPPAEAALWIRAGFGRRILDPDAPPTDLPASFVSASTYEMEGVPDTLVLDAFEREGGRHVWHGQVLSYQDQGSRSDEAEDALYRLLATFPPPGGDPRYRR